MARNILLGLLLIVASANLNAQNNKNEMKFISYNVLHGFNNDVLLQKRYIDWITKENPDVIAYQELNGFTQDSLENLGKKYGHPYALLNTGVTHPIGITSRYPIVMAQQVTTNMWHSYLYGNIKGIHFFIIHLSPFEVQIRRNDIDRILAHAKLIPSNEKIIIAGDFNALAAADSAQYGQPLLDAFLKTDGKLQPKSGTAIVKFKTIYYNNLNQGRLDYTVTNRMIQAGFKDSYYLTNTQFKYSAPTKAHAAEHGKKIRIDYIWVNKPIAAKVKAADVIQDEQTNQLSDHYPVYIIWK
ncbi:endonuclease/exonuclease/phosphatase family protein [Pedobacter insulae]|uniref:Exonuclease III n=1 Tax=Pedobacter insulae TaxID=414048 RepID=A0A1I2UXM3_9SPHI|nr:endonuclease/exonuclease/phosphatase family protein [Pedobacter insulae]SFG80929.1 Exonuclease III [Pedobacter insulae]